MNWTELGTIAGIGVGSSVGVEALIPGGWKQWLRLILSLAVPAAAAGLQAGAPLGPDMANAALTAASVTQVWHHLVAKHSVMGYLEQVLNAVVHGTPIPPQPA